MASRPPCLPPDWAIGANTSGPSDTTSRGPVQAEPAALARPPLASFGVGGGGGVAEPERLQRPQVSHQVRLFILFDGSPAPRQPPLLEFGPGPGGDAARANRAEAEGCAPVLVFEVL